MKRQMAAVLMAVGFGGIAPTVASAQTLSGDMDREWGVLSELAGRKFVWNSGRARGSDDSELTFHDFQWRGTVLAQTQCSYWPLRSMRAVCGTHLIEKLPDGSLLLKANGGKPYFKGTVAANGSVEFVNKTLLGKFVTAFVVMPDGSVVLTHANRVDGDSRAPLLPVDAARESEIMADMESIYAAAQAQKREEAERRWVAFTGAMDSMNAALSAGLEVAKANEARSRAALEQTIAQGEYGTRLSSGQTGANQTGAVSARAVERPGQQTADGAAAPHSNAVAGPGAPLRFVLSIGLQPREGDRVNPTCYSGVITRSGPPGWRERPLPTGSSASARSIVLALRSRFIAACRAASGRDVTSEGNFEWTWNDSEDGEQRMAASQARFPEDVTVTIN